MLQVTVDRYTRTLLTIIAVLLALVAVGLYAHVPATLPTVEAQIPDSGGQRQVMIEQLRQVNGRLTQINEALGSTLKMEIVGDVEHEEVQAPR